MTVITSRSNPKIKYIRALRQRRKEAYKNAKAVSFIVEGIHHVGQAVEAGAEIVAIYYAPHLLTSEFAHQLIADETKKGTVCIAVSQEVFNSIADKENPQGILSVVRQPRLKLAGLKPHNFPWGVALISPQDPGNVGAILRTVDAVGASGLLLLEDSVDPTHPGAVRASMGAIFWLPVVTASFAEFITWVKSHGYHIYGTSAHSIHDYHLVQAYLKPCILLMGSEREGLSSEQRDMAILAGGQMLRIPMHGKVTSLNLAVATGIMLYEMIKQQSPND
jgi:TrmH family RNA methyltransferase